MAYTPTEWKTGDLITEEKLNHIEEGIGDGGLPKNTSGKISTADGTFEFELDGDLYRNTDIKAPLIAVGEEYSITWDGVKYNFVGESPLQAGSHEILDGQTGEYPFYFSTDMGIFICFTLDDSPTHTIKIEKSANSIKPGTAMVFDGNKWIRQEGYAYIEKTHEDIVWEGDTNGRDSFNSPGEPGLTAYKISDLVLEPSDLIGCLFTANGQTVTITSDMIISDIPGVTIIGGEGGVMIFSETSISSGGMTIEVPSTGVYSLMSCSISFPKTVHTFDSELLGSSGGESGMEIKIFHNEEFSYYSGGTVAAGESFVFPLVYGGEDYPVENIHPLYAIIKIDGGSNSYFKNCHCITRVVSSTPLRFEFNFINNDVTPISIPDDGYPYAVVCLIGNGELDWSFHGAAQ